MIALNKLDFYIFQTLVFSSREKYLSTSFNSAGDKL